ncbi:hypothetical protein BP5796_02351 [Coleophoma crateriformis]|uniref:SAP domain-containing protein n=1 Tax=Coleophoma crateriformis TaxID=565419 RepID=A0A3D8SY03_9HELO|nr:hypothetical protein BP5796_02351 [Coleophoma crateriformis]
MSRVTPPVTKFTHAMRALSSTSHLGHPSLLLDSQARQALYLPRSLKDLKAECSRRNLKAIGSKVELVERLATADASRAHSTFGGHRPMPSTAAPVYKVIPLMQGFRTSAPKQAAHDSSSIDFMFFPEIEAAPDANPFAKLRVPLAPDNYTPDRSVNSAHAVESLDDAIPRPEISIIAAHPENVTAAALTEVVDNAAIDVPLETLTAGFSSTPVSELKEESSSLKELWNGFVDDVFGGTKAKASF